MSWYAYCRITRNGRKPMMGLTDASCNRGSKNLPMDMNLIQLVC